MAILPEVDGAILLPEVGRAIILPEVGGAKRISELHLNVVVYASILKHLMW